MRAQLDHLSLDYAKNVAEGDLSVYVPFDYLEWLVGADNRTVVDWEDDGPGGIYPVALGSYAHEDMRISWTDSTGQQQLATVTFNDVVRLSAAGVPVFRKNVDLRLAGSAAEYPSDSWLVDAKVTIRWPDFVHKPVTQGAESDNLSELDLTTAGLSGLDGVGSPGALHLRRPVAVQGLLYIVALAPLLLAAAAEVSRRHGSHGGSTSSLEVAAALISIFALRAVLVPSELPGLTRLDYLLAGETVVIVSVVSLTVAFRPSAKST